MSAVDPEGRIRHPLDVFHSTFNPDGSNVPAGYLATADGLGQVEYVDPATIGSSFSGDAVDVAIADAASLFVAGNVEAAFQELAKRDIGVEAHGAMGAAETFSAATGTHTGTLTADCTVSLTPVANSASMALWLEQDATGGWVIDLPASVVNKAAIEAAQDTTPSSTSILVLWTIDNGTSWIGGWWGAGGSTVAALDDLTDVNAPAPSDGDVLTWDATPGEWVASAPSASGALDDLSDVTITSVAANDTLRRVGSAWVNDNRRWEPVTTNPGTGPELVWDGDDIVMTWRAY